MTESWTPSTSVVEKVEREMKHIFPSLACYSFTAYHMDAKRNRVRSQSEWDREFLAYCAHREERWRHEHPGPQADETWMRRRPNA